MTGATEVVYSDAATLLSRWWSRPVDGMVDEWDATWSRARDVATALGADAEAIEDLVAARGESASESLLAEYERLFVGPARPSCPPYESLWREDRSKLEQGRLMGEPSAAIGDLYRRLDLDVTSTAHELPDQIAIEWEAVGYALHVGGAGGEAVASALLHEHLLVWLPPFCDAVRREARDPFYRVLAAVTLGWAERLAGSVAVEP